jgi:hypothetical protein
MKITKPNLGTFGRILFALPFGILGLNHFLMTNFYAGIMTSFIPGGGFTILFTGFLLIVASIAIMVKRFVTLSCLVLAALLFLFIVTIHIPQLFDPKFSDNLQHTMVIMQLFTDMALMGGALMIAHIYKPEKGEI